MRPELVEAGPGVVLIGGEALARVAWLLDTAAAIADRSDQVALSLLDREVVATFHRQALAVKAQRERDRLDVDLVESVEDLRPLTAAEVAPILGITERGVTYRAKTGKLPGWKKGRPWQFDRDVVERMAAEERSACR